MEDEVPPDGLSERQLIKWFKDAPKRKKERELKEEQLWKEQQAKEKRKKDQIRRRQKIKEEKKLNKKKSALRKRNAKKRKREKEKREKEERRKNRKPGGFATTEYKISPALQACCGGVKQISRPQATKQIWNYIKSNNLQNPSNRREIICDEKLLKVFENNKTVNMMHIAKFLSSHFLGDPISTVKSGSSGVKGKGSRKKQKVESESQSESESEDDDDSSSSEEESSSSDDDDVEPSNGKLRRAIHSYLKGTDLSQVTIKSLRKYLEKKFACELKERKPFLKQEVQKFLKKGVKDTSKKKSKSGGSGGLSKEHSLSADLSAVCGGKKKMSRPQVVKALWVYIRANNLQNPENKREILCDDAFKKVMDGNDKVTMFSMNKFVGAHLS